MKKVKPDQEITNEELLVVNNCILHINATKKNPFGWGMSVNEKDAVKKVKKYQDLIQEIVDKYCTKSTQFEKVPYKLQSDLSKPIKDAKSEKAKKIMISLLTLKDYDAGKKQDEFEKKLDEANEATIVVNFKKFSMSDKIHISQDEEVTLDEKIRMDGEIKVSWLTPLADIILTD